MVGFDNEWTLVDIDYREAFVRDERYDDVL